MIESVEVVIRQPGFPDRVVPLQQGRTQMGRADDNDIVLADVGVSRRHAQIVVSDTEVSVEDLGSGNGTYYFGHRVSSQPLRDQDEVVIDPFVLHFRIQGGMAGGDAPTVAAEPEGARIEVVVGNGMVGSLFPISENGLTMGRAEDRDIVVPDPASSRHHCHITIEQGEYVLHDNGSANGVFVNAVRVRECTLSNGDLVRIGNTEMRFVNPSAEVHDMMAVAAADPMVSAPEPAVDFPIDPHPRHHHVAEAQPSGRGAGGILMAVGGVLIALLLLGLVTIVVVLAITVILVKSAAPPAPYPAVAPRWELVGPLPSGSVAELDKQGRLATEGNEHGKALGYYRAVLEQDPGHNTAAKFAAFSGTTMLLANLEAQKTAAVQAREDHEKARDYLLVRVQSRRYRDKTRARLEREFREDPIVQEQMKWAPTPRQNKLAKDVDKARNQIELQDRQAEGIKLLRRVLEEADDGEIRNTSHQLIAAGVEHQVNLVADRWRDGIQKERTLVVDEAEQIFQRILTADASNVSAAIHIRNLEDL